MSKFFGSDTVSSIENMLDGNEPEPMEDAPVEELEAPAEDVSASMTEDEKEEVSKSDAIESALDNATASEEQAMSEPAGLSDDGDVKDGSHRVPYNRFKQVIEARNQLRTERDTLSQQVADLAKQMDGFRSSPQEAQAAPQVTHSEAYSTEMPEFLTEEEQVYFQGMQSQFQTKYSGLEKRVQGYELHMAQQNLEKQITGAIDKYPDVPRRAILEAVASDGNADIMDVAERYSSFVSQLREEAIANYLKENGDLPAVEEPKKVAPRPSKSSNSSRAVSSPDAPKMKNLKEANKALHKFLKSNPIF